MNLYLMTNSLTITGPAIKFDDKEEVLAKVKKSFELATFVSQDLIEVEKRNGMSCGGPSELLYRGKVKENLGGYTFFRDLDGCFLGEYYFIKFYIPEVSKWRYVGVVTKEQYCASLRLLGFAKEAEIFAGYRDEDFYYLGNVHCEESIDGYPPIPYFQPLGLQAWTVTKLIQRLSYDGYNIKMPGIITLVRNQGDHILFNQRLTHQIDNQEIEEEQGEWVY